jgi:hypothetical protein
MATDFRAQLRTRFPRLGDEGCAETSPATPRYNCLAWAAGQTDHWWWPDAFGAYYWPEGAPRAETIDGFVFAFETLGYERCGDGILEPAAGEKGSGVVFGERCCQMVGSLSENDSRPRFGQIGSETQATWVAAPPHGSATRC